jgi:hypothetical protein
MYTGKNFDFIVVVVVSSSSSSSYTFSPTSVLFFLYSLIWVLVSCTNIFQNTISNTDWAYSLAWDVADLEL